MELNKDCGNFSIHCACLDFFFSTAKDFNIFRKMNLKPTILITLVVLIKLAIAKRGPHHPRGEYIVKRDTRKQEFTEHLSHDTE